MVCVAKGVQQNKREAIERLGAQLILAGDTYDEAAKRALELQLERGLVFVHPFDDPQIVAGQGTIGLELLEALPEINTVLVPLSGGGLISGVAMALKAAHSQVRVVGVSVEAAPVMYHSLKAGRPVTLEEEPTVADALVGGLGRENKLTFRIVQSKVDDVVLVSESEIGHAMTFALQEHKLVVEGGGAVGIAAILHGRVPRLGRNVAVVVSGSNVDLPVLLGAVQNHL